MGALLQILLRALPKSDNSEAEYEVDHNTVTCTFCSSVTVDHAVEKTATEERHHEAVHLVG